MLCPHFEILFLFCIPSNFFCHHFPPSFLIWLILAQILLYTDGNLDYYKVLVANGTRLVGGATAVTCKAAGMSAVCPGSYDCAYISASCLVTPISGSTEICDYGNSLSKLICNTTAPKCPDFEGVSVFVHGYYGGDYFILDNGRQQGIHYVAGDREQPYYAYCVVCSSCEGKHRCVDLLYWYTSFFSSLGWSQWSSCGANCKKTRTRTCSGGNECAASRISEEQCQDGHCNTGNSYISFAIFSPE